MIKIINEVHLDNNENDSQSRRPCKNNTQKQHPKKKVNHEECNTSQVNDYKKWARSKQTPTAKLKL